MRSDPDVETCCGLGNRKNRRYRELLDADRIDVFDSTVTLIRQVRENGKQVGVVSASGNCLEMLRMVGLIDLFDAKVSGIEAQEYGLAGKPAPDTFAKAAEMLDVPTDRVAMFDDSEAGVTAARASGAGLVVGVARRGTDCADRLSECGADLVVADLGDLAVE